MTSVERPRLLDLFCGAGGAAMGYHRAGFDVVGVDNRPQPNYPFEFVQADAIEFLNTSYEWLRAQFDRKTPWLNFDAIHASPPCQHYSRATAWRGDRNAHPDLIAETRELLLATGLPYVIENVQEARRQLRNPLMLCGSAVGLPIRRHRYFEANWPLSILTHPCHHRNGDYSHDHGFKQTESVYRAAMECDWMTAWEAREAVPPAYTELIGTQLLVHVNRADPTSPRSDDNNRTEKVTSAQP